MDSKQFKQLFDQVAKAHAFEKAFGGWFRESSECIVVLDLQKSNYDNYYELNLKVYVHGLFVPRYQKGKDLVKRNIGNVFVRQPAEFNEVLALYKEMNDLERKQKLENLFNEFIDPFTQKALSKTGILEMGLLKPTLLTISVKQGLEDLVHGPPD